MFTTSIVTSQRRFVSDIYQYKLNRGLPLLIVSDIYQHKFNCGFSY